MIDWPTLKPVLKQWVTAGTGIAMVVFENEPAPFKEATFAELRVTGVGSFGGMDDVTQVTVETSPGVFAERQNISGQRSFALQISVWSDKQTGETFADIPLDSLKTKSQMPRFIALLETVNVARSSFGDCANGDLERDDRSWSVWVATAEFNCSFNWTSGAEDSGDVIEQVAGAYRIPSDAAEVPFTAPT